MSMYVGVTMWFLGGECYQGVQDGCPHLLTEKTGFGRLWPENLVLVNLGRRNWFWLILAKKNGFWPEKLVLVDFDGKKLFLVDFLFFVQAYGQYALKLKARVKTIVQPLNPR